MERKYDKNNESEQLNLSLLYLSFESLWSSDFSSEIEITQNQNFKLNVEFSSSNTIIRKILQILQLEKRIKDLKNSTKISRREHFQLTSVACVM